MIERNITLPDLILWTGTRVALGAGIGMLISRRLTKDAMKAAGLALAIVGGFTTIPLAIALSTTTCLLGAPQLPNAGQMVIIMLSNEEQIV